jgi:tRNA (cytidine56-2'-O)-methyltransferase
MIGVLRLGHRISRDERITTHICLVARAFGAEYAAITGEHDEGVIESVRRLQKKWGAGIEVEWREGWKEVVMEWKDRGAAVVHLTMYGMPVQHEMDKIKKSNDVLVVVGGEKVPGEVYAAADFNIAVTGQPHSEVAALAVFLDRYFGGLELEHVFRGKVMVEPSDGKKIVKNWKDV